LTAFVLFSLFILREPLRLNHILGFLIVAFGVYLVVLGPFPKIVIDTRKTQVSTSVPTHIKYNEIIPPPSISTNDQDGGHLEMRTSPAPTTRTNTSQADTTVLEERKLMFLPVAIKPALITTTTTGGEEEKKNDNNLNNNTDNYDMIIISSSSKTNKKEEIALV